MNKDVNAAKTADPGFAPKPDPMLTLRPAAFSLSVCKGTDDERFEVQFMEELLTNDPCNEEALMVLGRTYTRRGEYEKGLAIDRRLARLRPSDPTVYYNLACSCSLLQQLEDGFVALEKAIALGYRDLGHMLKDPDLANLRQDQRFRHLVSRVITCAPGNS